MFRKLFIFIIINVCFLISIANAQSLQDSKNGFSLELPKDWKIIQQGSDVAIIASKDDQGRIVTSVMPKYPLSRSSGEEYFILKEVNNLLSKKFPDAVIDAVQKDRIANQKAVVTTFSYTGKNGISNKILVASFWVNNSIFQVTCITKAEKFEQLKVTFLAALNSLKLQSLTASDWADKGDVFKNNKEHDKAIEAYANAAQLDDKNAEYPYQLAYIYSEKGNFEQAIVEITKAIELKPKTAFYYHERAYSYIALKNPQLALEDDNKAIQLDSKEAIFYSGRGNAYAMMGKYEESLADFHKCLEIKGNYLDAEFNLGQVYDLMGRNEEAIKYYKIVKEHSDLPESVKVKVQARINGDWDSYREWI